MTQSRSAGQIHEDLTAFRDQLKSTRVLEGFLVFAGLVTTGVLLFTFLAGTGAAPFLRAASARWLWLVSLISAAMVSFAFCVVRPLLWNPGFETLARLAEERLAGIENAYVNAVQLSNERRGDSPMLLFAALDECAALASRVDVLSAVDKTGFRRKASFFGIVAALLLAYMTLASGSFRSGFSMLVAPSRFVSAVGAARISHVSPGDVEVVRGHAIAIEVGLEKALDGIPPGTVSIRTAELMSAATLHAVSPTQYKASLGPAQLDLDYLVEIGGTESRWYHVAVVERPAVKSLSVRLEYPEYTGRGHDETADASGNISAPVGTRVTLAVQATRPLSTARLQFDDSAMELLPGEDDFTREGSFVLRKDGYYRISLTDVQGNQNDSSVPRTLKAVPDLPPVVSLPLPGRDVAAAPGTALKAAVEVSDDYGVDEVRLLIVDPEEPDEPREAALWRKTGVKGATLPSDIFLDPTVYLVGNSYSIYATATDNKAPGDPGQGRSKAYLIRIVDPEAAEKEMAEAITSWREQLLAVLEEQKSARTITADEVTQAGAGGPGRLSAVGDAQVSIREQTAAVAADMGRDMATVLSVRRVLEGLVAGDMTAAVDLASTAASGESLNIGDVDLLIATQDRIIASLNRVLDVVTALLEDARDGKIAEGNEIPSDAQEQLTRLLEDLKRFVEEQKRIVDATNNLAALPVDDYTDETLELIRQLQTAEDDWSKFLKEAYSDLSKLPEMDFANPTMLEDLVETFSEVEMAADALAKEPVIMAVPHEQAGLELAEELTTHLEKWLPDTPDRWKWEMEEPLGDIEVPMAELPTSLQDIIGELMEDEEDLFSDIEDISSAWADSLDKGAGWDALDGPISNMSAQGVTGNALPNSSEISGRSGEGRSGKAHGEFVGDSAVGKGGRRTPTRITPDPFVAGDVNDTSSDPPGGATGGGKVSGAGEEGLQGQIPRELAREIAALSGRQSRIISRAQKLNIALQLSGYPNADMAAALEIMRETEDSLNSARLGNAIRRRAVLVKNLKNVGSVVSRDLIVRKDNALVLPDNLREDIIDQAARRAPKGYDRLLESYYESLSVTE